MNKIYRLVVTVISLTPTLLPSARTAGVMVDFYAILSQVQ